MEALPFWCVKGLRKSSGGVLPRSRSGLANDELVGKRLKAGFIVPASLDQQLDGAFSDVLDRLPDRRERRPYDFGHRRVVEPGDRNIPRDLLPGPMQGKHRARGHVIVGAGERGESIAFAEETLGGL